MPEKVGIKVVLNPWWKISLQRQLLSVNDCAGFILSDCTLRVSQVLVLVW